MAFINQSAKEIQVKIVFYGPGRCGKTTNLLYVNQKMNAKFMGQMISIDTGEVCGLWSECRIVNWNPCLGAGVKIQVFCMEILAVKVEIVWTLPHLSNQFN